MLHFINGGSGSGKTTFIINKIKECVQKNNEQVRFIVPEQQSFESDKLLLDILGEYYRNKVETVTFSRFPDFMMRNCGGFCGEKIDNGGKRILMSCAIDDVKNKLTIYASQCNNSDFIEMMLAVIKEYKNGGINENILYDIAGKLEQSVLKNKILDCALIYQAYNALVNQDYVDADDDLDKVCELLQENNLFDDNIVFIDGFSGFTIQQLKIVECIIKQSKEFYIALPNRDFNNKKDNNIFNQIIKTEKYLTQIANDNNIKIDKINCLKDYRHKNNEAIEYFCENIYANHLDLLYTSESTNNIVVYNSNDKYEEIAYVANSIKELIINGYSYKDIVIVTRDINTYSNIIKSIFSKCDIPLFMDTSHSVESKPLIKLIISAFNIIKYGFETSTILSILKTELTGIDLYDIGLLENYAYMWSLKPSEWKKEFTKNPNGFDSEVDNVLLEKLEELRKAIINPIINLNKNIKCDNGADMAKAVYTFLEELKVDERVQEYSDYLKEQNVSEELINEQIRLWEVLVDVLDQMYMTLSDRYITVDRFIDLFKLVIECHSISYIPQRLDQVSIGSAERIRFNNPKIVFIIGAEEGIFPHAPIESGIFTDIERKTLISMNFPISDDIGNMVLQEKYYAYMAVSAPSEKLFISYCNFDLSGERVYKSSIVRELYTLLPNIHTKTSSNIGVTDKLWNEALTFDMCADLFNVNTSLSSTLKKYFETVPKYQSKIEAIEREKTSDKFSFKNPKNTNFIFNKNMYISPSQIETYHSCSCKYLISYGFSIYERKKADIDFREYGSLMHYLLENIIKNNTQNGDNSFSTLYKKDDDNEVLNENILKELINNYLKEYIDNVLGGMEDKSQRTQYILTRLLNTALTVVSYVIKSLKDNNFKPVFFELAINNSKEPNTIEPYQIKTENGSIYVTGKIDRVDVFNNGSDKYIRIIDYKTSKKAFSLNDIVNGLNMQMLIYLDTLYKTQNNIIGKIEPAGIIYSPASVNVASKSGTFKDKSEVEKVQDNNMKMNGIVINSDFVVDSVKGYMEGLKIDKKANKVIAEESKSVITKQQMLILFNKVENNIKEMYFNVQKGKIKAKPMVEKNYSSCDYCSYRSICCFEKGMEVNKPNEMDKKDVLKMLEKEMQGE